MRQDGCNIVSTKQTKTKTTANTPTFRDRTNPLDYMTDTQILHNYRLDRESIYELCHELEAELARPTRRVHALPVSLQIMIALRYFASGSYMNAIGDAHGVSKMSVSRSIHSIAKNIAKNIGLSIYTISYD
jgi:DNA-directed RNA polymerase specialized sigma subunit